MNSTSQLDFHPDAESLNAFAEKALPERERGQIVAHLAECGRCRQVIFLARQAAAEMEVEAVPAARAAGRSGSWLSDWRLAFVPAAALATVVGLAFLFQGRHEETRTEMARAVPQSVPHGEASVAKPAAKERVIAGKTQGPASPVPAKNSEGDESAHLADLIDRDAGLSHAEANGKIQSTAAGAAYVPAPAEVAPPRAAATESVTVTAAPPLLQSENASAGQVIDTDKINATPLNGRNWVYIAQLTAGQNSSAAPSAPQPPTAGMRQRVTGTNSSNTTAAYAPKAKMDEMTERDQASRKARAGYAGSGGASTSHMKKNAMPRSSYDAGGQMPALQFEAAPEAKPAALPSGLTAVSTATADNRTLAIDQAGALFLSNDSGSHWESVAQQWSGRAVDVISLQFMNGSAAAAGSSGGAAAAPAPAAEVFELRNDKNLTWVSMDGKTWTAQ
jgi:Putative zinc-finger